MESTSSVQHNYSIGERVLRLAVFQVGALQGLFERVLMSVYERCANRTCFPEGFNVQRAELGLESFKTLGAAIELLDAQYGKIHTMTLSSEKLEKKLNALGATWDKIFLQDGSSILAII